MISITKDDMIRQNPNITSKDMEMGIEMMKKFSNPLIVLPVTLAMYSFIGLLYSLIVGAIVKNQNPQSL
jgi:hypothetical protein